MAAVLACGPGAVVSHRSAADHLELRRSGTRMIDVTVPSRGGRRPPGGVRVHRSLLPTSETTTHRGVPVTTVARTLLDLAAVVDRRSLERAVEQAEKLGIFDLAAVHAVLAAHPRRAGVRRSEGRPRPLDPRPLTPAAISRTSSSTCAMRTTSSGRS